MRLKLALALIAAMAVSAAHAASSRPTARLSSGQVRGVVSGNVNVFRGLPYAAPPVGALRWRPPMPAPRWAGIRDASANAPACLQNPPAEGSTLPPVSATSEDCLYLNVFAPPHATKAPVMVWLHGGPNSAGSGMSSDMRRFARDGVVVVSINYRLGAMGFFAHPALTKAAPPGEPLANYGLMDQMEALRWVQRNIQAFGGDPTNVTLAGQGGGGTDVVALLSVSPARDLINKAIVQSDLGWNGAMSLDSQERAGVQLVSQLRVRNVDVSPDVLRALPAAALVAAQGPARLTIDKRLMNDPPSEIWDRRRSLDVPLLIGANTYEASVRGSPQPAADVYTNGQGLAPARRLARQASSGAPSFLYVFSYVRGRERGAAIGAAHGAEAPYVQDTLAPTGDRASDRRAQAVATQMHSCWVAFIKTGRPNCASGPAWPAYSAQADQIYEFGDAPAVRQGFRKQELDDAEESRPQPGRNGRDGRDGPDRRDGRR